jgi:hypothetical protein
MAWLTVALRSVGTTLSAVLPFLRQRFSERVAGKNPADVPASLSDEVMNGALQRLGTLEPEDPLWKRCVTGLQGVFVRPEVFALPSVREWASRPQVRAGLKAAAEAALARDVAPSRVLSQLADEYADATGEDRHFADHATRIAVAFLQASVQGLVRDTGTAAIVQATTAELGRKLEAGVAELAEAAGLSKNRFVSVRFTQEGHDDLQRILRRRATPGQQTAVDLRRLISDFETGGRLAAAASSIQDDAVYWLARIEAAAGDATVTSQLEALEKRGYPVSAATWALVDLAKGDSLTALRRVRDLADPESQAAVFHAILKTHGPSAALQYVDDMGAPVPNAFTPIGWNNVCISLIAEGRVPNACTLLGRLPADVLSQCTNLYYLYAVSQLLPMLPANRHADLMQLGFMAVAEHVLDSPASLAARSHALEAAGLARQCAIDAQDDLITERCDGGIRCLRLLNPSTGDQEIVSVAKAMKEGEDAVRLVELARVFDIQVDTQPLENYLNRAQRLGGLNAQQLRAKLHVLNTPGRSADLIRFLDEEWASLIRDNSVEMLVAMKVQTLARMPDVDAAAEFLEAHVDEVSEAVSSRLRLMLRDARGEDPSDAAVELFSRSDAIEDLHNLVRVLVSRKRWQQLSPYSEQLFNREPNFENAMLRLRCLQKNRVDAKQVCEFLDGTVGQVEQKTELRSARAWSHFEAGNHLEAKRLNDELISERSDPNDVGLDINIAIRTGDWERFPSIGVRAWDDRAHLTGQMLLMLARLVGFSDPAQALILAQEAVAREGGDPTILVGAHAIAVAARREDLAMPWVHTAAELSKQGGPVSEYSYREMVEFMKSNAENWKQKNEMYRTAQMPLHVAASLFNAPFSQLLIAGPRQNAKEVDPRRRQPTPIRSGGRVPAGSYEFSRIALDITSLFVLSELGRLGDILDSFEQVFVSPRLMDVLLDDRSKVAFHQPSRIAEVKPLSGWVAAGRMRVVDSKVDMALMAEVGDEAAVLLKEAEAHEGMFIHPGRLFAVTSYMDRDAALGALEPRLADPLDVVRALREGGVITQASSDEAVEVLQRMGMTSRQVVAPMAPLFLDGLTVQYLQSAKVLEPLLNSGHVVSIHKSTVDEWHALLATEPMTDELTKAIDSIRAAVRTGLMSGKVKFLAQSRKQREELSAITLLPMLDLLEDTTQIEVVVVDDRMFGNSTSLTDSNGRSVPILSSLDLLDVLTKRGRLSDASRREALHLLRSRCFFCIPIDAADLFFFLSQATVENGRLKETAELRTIRQYLARLNSTDVLCTASDLVYQDSLWRTGSLAIRKIWADPAISVADASVKSDWVIASVLPSPELVMRFSPNGEERFAEVLAAQLTGSMMLSSGDNARRSAYALWLDRVQLSPLSPSNSSILDLAVEQLAQLLMQQNSEIASELRSRDSKNPAR